MSEIAPGITIERFSVEFPRSFRYRRPMPRDIGLTALAETARHAYEVSIGEYRALSPRRQSRVERRVHGNVDDVRRALGLPFEYDPVIHEHRAAAELRVPWSWPRLPIWIGVSEVATGRAAISITLRSRRRIRYPRRYYAAAHSRLRAIRSG